MSTVSKFKRTGPSFLIVAALGAGTGFTFDAVGSPKPVWPKETSTLVLHRPVQAGLFVLAFRFPDAESRSVTLITGSQQTVIAMDNSAKSLAIRLPPDEAGQIVVAVDPPASVVVSRQPGVPEHRAIWRPTRDGTLQSNQPAHSGIPARASVNESDMLGVRTFGVPVRSGPHITDQQVAMVGHGDRLEADCWAIGDTITTDLQPRPQDLPVYTSNIWFRVKPPKSTWGYIPDVRFSRTDMNGRLGLSECVSSTN
jgi:hypothetical protein